MQLKEAINLLQHSTSALSGKKRWADLGCGKGLFSKALAHLLEPGSTIYCVDTDRSSLQEIPVYFNEQAIEKISGNFITDALSFDNIDGILMANSLHFVKDKPAFIQRLKKYLRKEHCFFIVEYDTDKSNRWVPYPVSFQSLRDLFNDSGYISVEKLNESVSVYNNGNIYSAFIKSDGE